MSYNVDTCETIECLLTFPQSALSGHPIIENVIWGEPGESTPVSVLFDAGGKGASGFLSAGIVTLTDFSYRGEGSGHNFDHLKDWLRRSSGRLDVVFIWEGGDSISRLLVEGGTVTDSPVDVASLIRGDTDLQAKANIADLAIALYDCQCEFEDDLSCCGEHQGYLDDAIRRYKSKNNEVIS